MLPAGLGSTVSRPYYNRRKLGGPPVPTAIGTAQATGAPNILSLTIAVNVPAGSTLIAAINYANNSFVDAFIPTAAGVAPSASVGIAFALDSVLWVLSWQASNGPYVGNLVFDFSTGTGFPTFAAAAALMCTNLVAVAPEDVNVSAAGFVPGNNHDSGLTVADSQASEFIYGAIGTDGSGASGLGAWTGPLVALQNIGTAAAGAQIKIGVFQAAAISTFRAQTTGAAVVNWAATCQTFKGV